MRFSLQFSVSPHQTEHRTACEQGLTALAIIGGIKAAFIKHAREDLGLTEPEPETEE